tara:strand:+ start:178 stop:645 length:468 start_codon:yes stop_codon:yes gene_type:complete
MNNEENKTIEIKNISSYNQKIDNINNTLILIPKNIKKYISFNDISNFDLTNSKINKCEVYSKDNIITNKNKYQKILTDIWNTMLIQNILQNTTFNFKLSNENTCGYRYIPKLKVSFQGKDANKTMHEIIKMIKLKNYSIDISIELENKDIIYLKN